MQTTTEGLAKALYAGLKAVYLDPDKKSTELVRLLEDCVHSLRVELDEADDRLTRKRVSLLMDFAAEFEDVAKGVKP